MSAADDDIVARVNKQVIDPNRLKRSKNKAYIQDADMQIHVPSADGGMKKLENTYSFKKVLDQYLSEVNTLQHDADAQIQRLASGQTEDVHEVMMAMDEAETAFSMMMEIRDKLVDSYREVMRMQI